MWLLFLIPTYMKELILRHLSNNYMVTLNSYTKFMLYDQATKEEKYLGTVMEDTIALMGIDEEEFEEAWDKWIDTEIRIFENKVVDYQYHVYEKTGIELDLHNPRFQNLLLDDMDKVIEKVVEMERETPDEDIPEDEGILAQIRRHNTATYRGH